MAPKSLSTLLVVANGHFYREITRSIAVGLPLTILLVLEV